MGEFFSKYQETIYLEDDQDYIQVSVRNTGVVEYRCTKKGKEIGRKRQYIININRYPNTLTFTRQTIYEGGIGFVPKSLNGAIVTENMPLLSMNEGLDKFFAIATFQTNAYFDSVISHNKPIGSAQQALHEKIWLNSSINVPKKIDEQRKIGLFFKLLNQTITLHQRELICRN